MRKDQHVGESHVVLHTPVVANAGRTIALADEENSSWSHPLNVSRCLLLVLLLV